MVEPNIGAEFLQQKYHLNSERGPKVIGKRRNIQEFNYIDRIKNYLDWLSLRDPVQLKESLHRQLVIKPNEIPEAYFESVERQHLEEGRGVIKLPEPIRKELANTLIEDQKKSLDLWVDYLTSDEAKMYPEWLRYFVFRSVSNMGRYDKERKTFTERTGGTTAPFLDLNHEALNVILSDFIIKYGTPEEKKKIGKDENTTSLEFTSRYDISQESGEKYKKSIENKNFEKLYALTLEEYKPIADELLRNTEGEWRMFRHDSDPKLLVDSISPYGTGWCIRGEGMARQYLHGSQNMQKSDLLVYYSKDKEGKFTIPRVVMVIRGEKIDEVRGVWTHENLDPYIGEVVDKKLTELPDGKRYKKRSADMKKLTAIYYKVYPEKAYSKNDKRRDKVQSQPLTKDDLAFLYEVDAPILGFGYDEQDDPRIVELRSTRNKEEDMLTIFENQIAKSAKEINQYTKAYVGPLENGIFDLLSKYHIEHVYTSFPERKIRLDNVEIGGKSAKQLKEEIIKIGGQISSYAKGMLHSRDFTTLKNPTPLDIVWLKVSDLGFDQWATTDQIYKRAQELGLDLCPAEAGPHLRLKDQDQPIGGSYYVGMKQISVSGGCPCVFKVDLLVGEELWLFIGCDQPGHKWSPSTQFVFALRKPALPARQASLVSLFLRVIPTNSH